MEKTSCDPRNGSESHEEPPGHLHSVEGDDEDGADVDATRMLQRKIEAFRLAGRQTYTFVMGQRVAVSV